MKKNIFIVVLSLLMTSGIGAATPAKPLSDASKSALVKKLVNDKNFQSFSFTAYKLGGSLQTKSSVSLLVKYLKKEVAPEEMQSLLTVMNLKTETELSNLFKDLSAYRNKIRASYPELKKDEALDEVVKIAAAQASRNLNFGKKSKTLYNECWLFLTSSASFCWEYCGRGEDPQCNLDCYLLFLDAYTICMLWQP